MSQKKEWVTGAIRQEICQLEKVLETLEDESEIGSGGSFDMGSSQLEEVEGRLKTIRKQIHIYFSRN
jgi:hypothetical protein